MDVLTARIYASVAAASKFPADSDATLSVFMRSFNAQLLSAAWTLSPLQPASPPTSELPSAADVDHMLRAFLWTTACCKETTHISDTYNATHLCGIVLCKHFHLCTRTLPPALLDQLFPGSGCMHVAPGAIHSMPYDTLVQVLTALQHEWPRLTTTQPQSATAAVIACMARFGAFLLFHQSATTLDDISKHELVAENATLLRPTKRCTRAIVNTCLCLLRNAAMLACVRHTRVRHVDAPHARTLVYAALFQAEHGAHAKLAPRVRACAARVRHIRASLFGSMDSADIDDPDVLWAFLVKHLGSPRIGVLPRRRDAALVAFLQHAVLFIVQQSRAPADMVICGATMCVIETALRYFYVVPSADKFRHIDLLETVSTGHRLNYALDYAAFDTGVLSQVVYLHNPLFKQRAPPACIAEWTETSNAGPIAAFCQLLPDLQVWYEDCQDPLGVRGESTHISKPSDNETTAVHAPGLTQWVLLVSRARVLLVDRSCAEIHMVSPAENATSEHHALATLMLYIYKTNQMATIATVAINGYKISNAKAAEPAI